MKKRIHGLFCFVTLGTNLSATVVTEHPWTKTHAAAVAEKNLNSLPHEDYSWSAWSLEEYANGLWKELSKPVPRRKRELAFNVFKAEDTARGAAGTADKSNMQTWHDLSLLCGQTDPGHYVAKVAIPTITEVGQANTCLMLTKPTSDMLTLQQHQAVITDICTNATLRSGLTQALGTFAQHEHLLTAFWEERDHLGMDLQRNIYFNKELLPALNTNEAALQLSGLAGLGSFYTGCAMQAVACYVLAMYGVFKLTGSKRPKALSHGSNQFISNAGYFYSALQWIEHPVIQGSAALAASAVCGYNALEGYRNIRGISAYISTMSKITYHMAQAVRALHHIIDLLKMHNMLEHPSLHSLKLVDASPALQGFFQRSAQPCFASEEAVESVQNMGSVLAFLQYFLKYRPILQSCITELGYLDTMTACALNLTQQPERWCIPVLASAERPFIKATGFWHPLIRGNAIPSDITLGCDGHRPHAIITGPNEGGKSTAMKAIAIAAWLSQALGICPAQRFAFTPFTHIKTYLDIRDDIGAGNSLFRAEFGRAQELRTTISNAAPKGFCLCVFDEMCRGTAPIEGSASAYIITKELDAFSNCLCLVATHFEILTQLEYDTNTFKNYNVKAIPLPDGNFSYPRTLAEGPSNQHIALDILRNEGIGNKLIDEAACLVRSIAVQT